jgi:hypothetical protein
MLHGVLSSSPEIKEVRWQFQATLIRDKKIAAYLRLENRASQKMLASAAVTALLSDGAPESHTWSRD